MKKTYIAPVTETIAMNSATILAGSPAKDNKTTYEIGGGKSQGGLNGNIDATDGDESDAKFGRLDWNSDWE